MSSTARVRALARRMGKYPDGGRLLEHLGDCLVSAGIDPRTIDLPDITPPCPGGEHRTAGCPVAYGWHVRALRWVADALEDQDTHPDPGPPPPCYRSWAKNWTQFPLGRAR